MTVRPVVDCPPPAVPLLQGSYVFPRVTCVRLDTAILAVLGDFSERFRSLCVSNLPVGAPCPWDTHLPPRTQSLASCPLAWPWPPLGHKGLSPLRAFTLPVLSWAIFF